MWFLFSLYIFILIASIVLFHFQRSLYSVQYNYYKLVSKFPDLFGRCSASRNAVCSPSGNAVCSPSGNTLNLLGYSALTGIIYTDDTYLNTLLPNFKYKKITIDNDNIGLFINGSVGATGAVEPLDNPTISLRGTSNLQDILVSMDTTFTHVPDGKIHQGYYNKAVEIMNVLSAPKGGVNLCGHSMGGALASILGYLLHKQNPKLKIFVCTFGSPMYGDANLKDYLSKQKNIKITNYINTADPVVYKPTTLTNEKYKRIGKVIKWRVDSGNDNVNHNIRSYRACVLELKETRCKRTHRFDEILSRFFLDLLG